MVELSPLEVKIIKQHSFAQILTQPIANSAFGLFSYCPLLLQDDKYLLGHLAKGNDVFKVMQAGEKITTIFSGPSGYISPRWHKEQQVPTWNYASVSLICKVSFIEGNDEKLKSIKYLSHNYDPKWDFKEFSGAGNNTMVAHMLSAISVFRLEIMRVNSKFKLSQKRSDECRAAFRKELLAQGNYDLAEIQ